MADALISATIKVTLEKALSLATNRVDLLFGFKEDLASMTRSLRLIRAVLDDAEQRQRQNQAVQHWLNSLEGVAFDAENVLDEINYEFLRQKVESLNRHKRKVCCYFSFSNSTTSRSRMVSKVRDIKLKLYNINGEANGLGLVISSFQTAATLPAAAGDTTSRQTDSIPAPMIGRANDESKIVEMLLNPSEKVVSVLPIIGMGGLGKTTLAKSIYNKKQIDEYFDKKIWVCVSKKVQIVELFKLILVQLTKEKVEVDDRNVIVEKIREQLGEKRSFLVLDDAWNHEPEFWNDFFTTFKGFNPINGSWCLVTSRLQQLANIVSRLLIMDVEPYFLGRLPDDDCWSILKEKVIAGEEVPEELEAIRDRVIKRCNGLPLAASVIGGLLCLSAKEDWLSIVEKSLLSGDQISVEQILKVSFDYLSPASVKKCFAYCSIFPKDTMMEMDSLIELWMAEGFLQSDLENETMMEKIGKKYIRVLLQSSLLEETRNLRQVSYKMHDLVHDLAESILKSKSINLETDVIGNVNQVRYLNVSSSGENSVKFLENISTSLRTLFLSSSISDNMLSLCKNLHVLNLSSAQIWELPTSIGKLIHLRFINLSYSRIQTLPESLCKLYNLQTMWMLECRKLNGLPKRMGNLISLRHLHFYREDASFQMPLEMGRLTCLQTLEFFNVGQEKGRRIEELRFLKDLKGKLEIRNLELVKGKEEAEKANLNGKAHLMRLELFWSSIIREGDDSCEEDVLEGLQSHPNLQELLIARFMGDQFPGWLMNLSRLVELELRDCKRCRELPVALGQKRSLKNLKLSGLENIRCIGLSFYRIDDDNRSTSEFSRKLFPALTKLTLRNMENLVEWMGAEVRSTTAITGRGEAEVVDVFPVLEHLVVDDCPLITTAPSHFPSLTKLEIKNSNHILVVKNILSKATTTLSYLRIEGMAELTCVSDIVAAAPTGGFQNLKKLHLWSCLNLSSIVPQALPNLASLEILEIVGCHGLTNLPRRMLHSCTSLQTLRVVDCPHLVSFPVDLQQTPSLSRICLCRCPKLKTNMTPKGFGFLTSLRGLTIGPFSDDENSSIYNELDWSGLASSWTLRSLTLYGLPHMESLPHQLQYLTTLTWLQLNDFGGIEALPDWLGNLASLQTLVLLNCKKLGYLPSMDAMRRLTKLRELFVNGCPLLRERCTTPQNSGPPDSSEWSKISHIRWRNYSD